MKTKAADLNQLFTDAVNTCGPNSECVKDIEYLMDVWMRRVSDSGEKPMTERQRFDIKRVAIQKQVSIRSRIVDEKRKIEKAEEIASA